MSKSKLAFDDRRFIEALREFLGLQPLYNEGTKRKTEAEKNRGRWGAGRAIVRSGRQGRVSYAWE